MRNVLVVDDVEDNRLALRLILETHPERLNIAEADSGPS